MANKEDFESLLQKCWLTQTRPAEVIRKITQRPLSPRTVRSWLTDPSNPSHRPCPDWAIDALREFQRRPMVLDGEGEADSPSAPDEATERAPIATLPYSFEELDAAFTSSVAQSVKRSKQKEFEHFRYRCPICKIQVWGAQGLILSCNTCDETMAPMND